MQRTLAAALAVAALAWSALILIAPWALVRGGWLSSAAAVLYQGASLICHQRPERSFHLAGAQLPVCARCAGLYFSGAGGAIAACLGWQRRVEAPRGTRAVLVVAAVPTIATVAIELLRLGSPSNELRALSAIPLGAAAGWIFVRSLRAEAGAPYPAAPGGRRSRGVAL
jgi:uncharacterized membrane protein